MPFLKWGIRGDKFSSIPRSEQDCKLPILATKKQLTKPYSPEHLMASIDRGSYFIGGGSRAMRETSAPEEKPMEKSQETESGEAVCSEESMNPSNVTAVNDDRSCTGANGEGQGDELTSACSEKLNGDVDPDRLSENEIYQRVPLLRANRYEHDSFSGSTAPSFVHSTKKFYKSASVIRLGKTAHENLTITGQTMDLTSKALKIQHRKLEAGDDFDLSINLPTGTNQRRSSDTGLSECIGTNADKSANRNGETGRCSVLSLDIDSGRQKEEGNESERGQQNRGFPSARPELSPAKVQMDSIHLPKVSPRSITGARMRFEVTTQFTCKPAEGRSAADNDNIDFNTQIAAVAKAQDIIDYRPSWPEREGKESPSVRLFMWRPALKDILHSESVSLRPRSMDSLSIKSTSPAKLARYAHQFPEIPCTLHDDPRVPITSRVSYRGKRLEINVDMRSLRLPPIFSYNSVTQSVPAKTDCVACVGGC